MEARVRRGSKKKKKNEKNLKRKMKCEEIDVLNKQKLNLQEAIDSLRKGIINETPGSDEKQDLQHTTKAASFCHTLQAKEKTYEELCGFEKTGRRI